MAKTTLPELKMPEFKFPKVDLDALFGLEKANLAVAYEAQTVLVERSRRSPACSTATPRNWSRPLKSAAATKAPAKPETVMAEVKAAAEKAVAVAKEGVDLGVAAQQRVVGLMTDRVKANVDELKALAA